MNPQVTTTFLCVQGELGHVNVDSALQELVHLAQILKGFE